jgi:dihydrofolate synthase/folylpolyglutamate synthase
MREINTLTDWLNHLTHLHPREIDLTLDRIKIVADRLQLTEFTAKVIIVGGTNGKGSTVALLEAMYCQAGYSVASYTSPHLLSFNERIKLQACPVADEVLLSAFTAIEAARLETPLTFFEFTTLAALLIFKQTDLDVILLEVGLGGRLDAVNIVKRDLSIITHIALDHCDWLGPTRADIAREKAGIITEGIPSICADRDPPAVIAELAQLQQASHYQLGKDFDWDHDPLGQSWEWWSAQQRYEQLPLPQLDLKNAATALMAVSLLQASLPVSEVVLREAIAGTRVAGRQQLLTLFPRGLGRGPILVDGLQSPLPSPPPEGEGNALAPTNGNLLLDVAHNPDGVAHLSRYLQHAHPTRRIHAVFSMLGDKDILACVQEIAPRISHWYLAPLQIERAANLSALQQALAGCEHTCYNAVSNAFEAAKRAMGPGDLLLVFGSFHTVSEVLQQGER